MATGKRFYWIKLKDTFFTSDTVDFIMSQPNGAEYIVLYQMLHMKTANTGGRLQRQIGEMLIPYDIQKIKRDCKWFSEDTIRVALELYKQLGLVYEDSNGVLVMADHENMVGQETDYAEKMRLYRKEQKELEAATIDSDMQQDETINNDTGYIVTSNVSDDVARNVADNVEIDNRDKILDIRVQSKDIDSSKENNKKKGSDISEDVLRAFNEFWSVYSEVRSDTRSEALHCFNARIKEGFEFEKIMACTRNYVDECKREKKERRWVLMPKTFLGPNLRFLAFEPTAPKKKSKDPLDGFVSKLPDGIVL